MFAIQVPGLFVQRACGRLCGLPAENADQNDDLPGTLAEKPGAPGRPVVERGHQPIKVLKRPGRDQSQAHRGVLDACIAWGATR